MKRNKAETNLFTGLTDAECAAIAASGDHMKAEKASKASGIRVEPSRAARDDLQERLNTAEMELQLAWNKIDLIRKITQSACHVDETGKETTLSAYRRRWRKARGLPVHILDT